MKPEIATLIRALLKVAGGGLTAKGLTDEGSVETATGAIIALVGVIWGIIEARKKKANPIVPVLLVGGLCIGLTGCATTPERQLLTISNGQVVLVDSAMIGWATYVKTHSVPATDIEKVRTAYRIYHKAALAEKQAWVSYVSTRNLDDVRRVERIVLDLRQQLLDLLLELDASGVAFDTAAERATEERKGEVTLADVEWAFTFLRPYEAYGIK